MCDLNCDIDKLVAKNSDISHSYFPMFSVRLKCGPECWPNLSSETGHQTESWRKKRKKGDWGEKVGTKSAKARLWNHMLAWWLAYLLVRNTFYIFLHCSIPSFFAPMYNYFITYWHRFGNTAVDFPQLLNSAVICGATQNVLAHFLPPTYRSNNSLLNGSSNQDIRSWFIQQRTGKSLIYALHWVKF